MFRMREERNQAAGVYDSRHGFVITGGHSGARTFSSAEKTTDGETFYEFPSLPIALRLHCVVSLQNDGGLFLTAGLTKDSVRSGRSFIYDASSNTWEELDALPTPRYGRV